ncbi:MAG: hypothetical protein EZS28_013283, partial [Streblomastix strix]
CPDYCLPAVETGLDAIQVKCGSTCNSRLYSSVELELELCDEDGIERSGSSVPLITNNCTVFVDWTPLYGLTVSNKRQLLIRRRLGGGGGGEPGNC